MFLLHIWKFHKLWRPGIGAILDCQKYSNLGKLLRVTGYVARFIKNIRLKMKNHELVLGTLATADINFAQLQ